jgi:hypothetical protein
MNKIFFIVILSCFKFSFGQITDDSIRTEISYLITQINNNSLDEKIKGSLLNEYDNKVVVAYNKFYSNVADEISNSIFKGKKIIYNKQNQKKLNSLNKNIGLPYLIKIRNELYKDKKNPIAIFIINMLGKRLKEYKEKLAFEFYEQYKWESSEEILNNLK